jgi:hypothetical protein
MIPVVLALSLIPKFSRESLASIIAVGISPVIAIFGSSMTTGKGVIEGFDLSGNIHWYFSVATAAGLLIATVFAARIQKSLRVLSLIPITVVPYLLLTFSDHEFLLRDFFIVGPVFLLILEMLLFMGKEDAFFSQYDEKLTQGFTTLMMILQSYVSIAVAISYAAFLIDHSDDNASFFMQKPAVGMLLFMCAAIFSYINNRNIFQELSISLLGLFSVGAIIDLTNLHAQTHRETRMFIAAAVVALLALAFRRNYLAAVLAPLTLVTFYITESVHSYNSERIAIQVIFIAAIVYGMYILKKAYPILQWFAAVISALWLVEFALSGVQRVLPEGITNLNLYSVGFVFLGGLALTEIFELTTVGKSYIFTVDTDVDYLRPARVIMLVAYGSTWFLANQITDLATVIACSTVVVIGVVGAWRRRESTTMILAAPTLIIGVYSLGSYVGASDQIVPMILVGLVGVWLFLSTYMKYAVPGCIVNASLCGVVGLIDSLDNSNAIGQVFFIIGLILIAIGVIRSIGALIPVGSVFSTIGFWITLATQEVHSLELYTAPVALGLIALGMYNRNVFGSHIEQRINDGTVANIATTTRMSSWAAYAFPLALFELSAFIESINTGSRVHSVIGGAVAIIAIALGAWRKLSAPLMIGTIALVIFIVREIFHVADAVPVWAWIATGALVLIGVAVVLEKSQMTPKEARRRVSAVVSDSFE